MRRLIELLTVTLIVLAFGALAMVSGADLSRENDVNHRFGWQDRARDCLGLTEKQCTERLLLQGTGAVGGTAAASAAATSGGNSGGSPGGSTGPK